MQELPLSPEQSIIISNFVAEFNKINLKETEKEYGYATKPDYLYLARREDVKNLLATIYDMIPAYNNRMELAFNHFEAFLKKSLEEKEPLQHKLDILNTLAHWSSIIELKNEFQIKQLIPNLEEIIKKMYDTTTTI